MATYKEVQESENQFIAGAAARQNDFLGVIMKRCNAAGLGVTLAPVQLGRKQGNRTVMRGSIVFGNAWKGKRPYILEVYADPSGSNLQVGFQLTTEEMGGIMANTNFGARVANTQTKIHNDPNTQRQLSGVLQGFYQMVFMPTVQDLIDAVGAAGRQSNGFLGA